jgi:ABC-type transporter Mla subunit MlaD
VPDLSGRELLREWRTVMDALIASAATVGGRTEIPHQLLESMQHQLELVQDVIERERRLQKQLVGYVLAPADAIFDLLEDSGVMLRRQAEALEAAGRAIEETAELMKNQAKLFERTVGVLREPAQQARAVAGLERRVRKGAAAQSRGGGQQAKGGGQQAKGGGQQAKGGGQQAKGGGRKPRGGRSG